MNSGHPNRYTDGRYAVATGGTWHMEDSPYKAAWIEEMLSKHPELRLRSVCEIGCGAGGILVALSQSLPGVQEFTGYEISAQAHQLSLRRFPETRVRFILGDAFDDAEVYDLALVIDVIEHVEDCFTFLRETRKKAHKTILHVPLDAHASAILRGRNDWDSIGHIHLFTLETALKTVEQSGYTVRDWFFTQGATSLSTSRRATRLANALRRPLNRVSPSLNARLLGGNSVLILAD